jgi:uncharacterized protein YdhG (YjbR/CyaY superfamily)
MADRKRSRRASEKTSNLFSDEERAAMKEAVRERKRRASSRGADGEADVLEKIASMAASDRALAERLHRLIKATAPSLSPRTWYGMPAYARLDDVVCFFQPAEKFKARYATLGFSDRAKLDDGSMWPVVFALKEWTPAEEARIAALLRKAVD